MVLHIWRVLGEAAVAIAAGFLAKRWSSSRPLPADTVRGEDGRLVPAPGFEWLNDRPDNYEVCWVPGKAHPASVLVLAGPRPGSWVPAAGYRWVSGEPDDIRVELEPGAPERSQEREDRALLGVNADATREEIERAFREIAHLWHPDKVATGGPAAQRAAAHQFKRLRAAYERLLGDC